MVDSGRPLTVLGGTFFEGSNLLKPLRRSRVGR